MMRASMLFGARKKNAMRVRGLLFVAYLITSVISWCSGHDLYAAIDGTRNIQWVDHQVLFDTDTKAEGYLTYSNG